MPVEMVIDWGEENYEIVKLGPFDEATYVWGAIGMARNHKHLVGVYPVPFEKDDIDEIVCELENIKNGLLEKARSHEEHIEILTRINALVEALGRMKSSTGWDATIG